MSSASAVASSHDTGTKGNGPLFAASFAAIAATSFCFILRALVVDTWGVAFALTQKTEYVANAQILVKIGDEHVYHPRSGQLGAGAITGQAIAVAGGEI